MSTRSRDEKGRNRSDRRRALDAPPKFRTSAEYESLSEAQREEISKFYDQPIPESDLRPMTAAERKQWRRIHKAMGRDAAGGSDGRRR